MKHLVVTAVLIVGMAGWTSAQTIAPDVFSRGVPSGTASATPLPLSLRDAIARGLEHNLGALIQEQRVQSAESGRWRALSDLLPHVSANVRETHQVVNAAAYGFTGFPGLPELIGPYSVFDARLGVSTPVLDLSALNQLRADRANVQAAGHDYRQARELVVLVVANLYLEILSESARAESARAQARTAETFLQLTEDQKAAGIVAGIDVLRQQVQRDGARQRVIVAENSVQTLELKLARAIGLPAGQAVTLSDPMPSAAAPSLTLEEATRQAYEARDDLKAAEARAAAARAAKQSALASALPSVHVDADYGALGPSASDTRWTYGVAANVHVPVFEGGRVKARVLGADAELRQREAELADLRAGVQYEISAALLTLKATSAAVEVARSGQALAQQTLDQAQDRFRAGLTNTLELAQAQDALAGASDRFVESLYAHNLAKASLGHALGLVEERFSEFVGGR